MVEDLVHLLYDSNRKMSKCLSTLAHDCAFNSGDLWGILVFLTRHIDPFYLNIGAKYVEYFLYSNYIHFKSVYKWKVKWE